MKWALNQWKLNKLVELSCGSLNLDKLGVAMELKVRKSELWNLKLGEVSFGFLKLDKLGEVSYGILSLVTWNKMSFGLLKLDKLGKESYGIQKLDY